MASASFRDSMSSLGWSRREADAPVNTSSPSVLGRLQNLNPFGAGGYVRLPITETNPGAPLPAPSRREEEEGWFARKSTSPSLRHCTASSLTRLRYVTWVCTRSTIVLRLYFRAPLRAASGLVMSSEDMAMRLVSSAQPWTFGFAICIFWQT
jgi:hypothetical protein